jgi:hypothetical protein
MTRLFWIAVLLGSAAAAAQTPPAPSLRGLAFMAGCWSTATGVSPVYRECFTAPYAGMIQGSTQTAKDGKTTSWEFSVITENDGVITYAPFFMGQALSTFTLTRLEGQMAVFENPTNEFPKKLIYRRGADGSLIARTEGAAADDPANEEWVMRPQGE